MNVPNNANGGGNTALENFAAKLTEAAYPVALRHGVRGSSVDLELDLWRALSDTVKEWGRDARRSIAQER